VEPQVPSKKSSEELSDNYLAEEEYDDSFEEAMLEAMEQDVVLHHSSDEANETSGSDSE
jgi:hypothetical protein